VTPTDPNDFVPGLTTTGLYDQTDLLLTWSPVMWVITMFLAIFGVYLLLETLSYLTTFNAPQVSAGSQPQSGSRRGGSYLED